MNSDGITKQHFKRLIQITAGVKPEKHEKFFS
jgi:hypothetical protein